MLKDDTDDKEHSDDKEPSDDKDETLSRTLGRDFTTDS
jgi:hypothetical protein